MRNAHGKPSSGPDNTTNANFPSSYVFCSSRYNPPKKLNGLLRVSYPDRPTLTKAQLSRHASGSTSVFDANPTDIPRGFVYFDGLKFKSEESNSLATLNSDPETMHEISPQVPSKELSIERG